MQTFLIYLSILILTIVSSCTKTFKKDSVPTEYVATPTPIPSPPVDDLEVGVENVIFVPNDTATKEEVLFTLQAQFKMNQVIQSDCFSQYLNKRKMIQTKNKTNSEVVAHIKSLKGIIPVSFYYKKFTKEMAVRYPPSLQININRKFYSPKSNICEFAGTLAHEAVGHSLGNYGHDFTYNAQRDFSVPYSLNAAFYNCCK
jgi:hypothetical protein